jgi:hypothetical protein
MSAYAPPLTVLRYTLYPETAEVLALQLSATECWTTPVPNNDTIVGEPLALLITEMLPVTGPVAVGLNRTVKLMFCVGDSVTGALPPVAEYPCPVTLICEMLILELPVFVITTVCDGDVVPVVMFPKLRLVGLTPKVRTAATPVPVSPTEVGDVGALLTMEIFPVTPATDVGRKSTVIVV